MQRRYYSPFEESPVRKEYEAQVIRPQKIEEPPAPRHSPAPQPEKACPAPGAHRGKPGGLHIDDIILIGILILLLMEEPEKRDLPLILGIGFLLLADYL